MRKSVILFWILFAGIVVFALGARFAYSQSGNNPFASSGNPIPAGSAWHDASKIWCDNCVTGNNLANGAVSDAEVSSTAAIHTSKINGDNGWFVTLPVLSSICSSGCVTPWQDVSATALLSAGQSWEGKTVEMICGSTSIIPVGAGVYTVGSTSIARNNHKVLTLYASSQVTVYVATDTSTWPIGLQYQTLEVSVGSNPAQLRFRRSWAPGAIIGGGTACGGATCEPQYNQFYCLIKLVS